MAVPDVRPRLVELHNGSVTPSSVSFAWEDPAALGDLRERFELDRVVDGADGAAFLKDLIRRIESLEKVI